MSQQCQCMIRQQPQNINPRRCKNFAKKGARFCQVHLDCDQDPENSIPFRVSPVISIATRLAQLDSSDSIAETKALCQSLMKYPPGHLEIDRGKDTEYRADYRALAGACKSFLTQPTLDTLLEVRNLAQPMASRAMAYSEKKKAEKAFIRRRKRPDQYKIDAVTNMIKGMTEANFIAHRERVLLLLRQAGFNDHDLASLKRDFNSENVTSFISSTDVAPEANLGTLTEVPLHNIMKFLPDKSLYSLSQVNHHLHQQAQPVMKRKKEDTLRRIVEGLNLMEHWDDIDPDRLLNVVSYLNGYQGYNVENIRVSITQYNVGDPRPGKYKNITFKNKNATRKAGVIFEHYHWWDGIKHKEMWYYNNVIDKHFEWNYWNGSWGILEHTRSEFPYHPRNEPAVPFRSWDLPSGIDYYTK